MIEKKKNETSAPYILKKTAHWTRTRSVHAKGITEAISMNYATSGAREARDLFALR